MKIRNVDEFIQYLIDNNLAIPEFINVYKQQNELIQQATVCKYVYNHPESNKEDKEWAKKWLEEHNMNVNLFERIKI